MKTIGRSTCDNWIWDSFRALEPLADAVASEDGGGSTPILRAHVRAVGLDALLCSPVGDTPA